MTQKPLKPSARVNNNSVSNTFEGYVAHALKTILEMMDEQYESSPSYKEDLTCNEDCDCLCHQKHGESKGMVEKESLIDKFGHLAPEVSKEAIKEYLEEDDPKEGSSAINEDELYRDILKLLKPGVVTMTTPDIMAGEITELVMAKLSAKPELVELEYQAVLGELLNAHPTDVNTNYEVDMCKVTKLICSKFGTKPRLPTEAKLIEIMDAVDIQGRFKIKYSPRPEIIKEFAQEILKYLQYLQQKEKE